MSILEEDDYETKTVKRKETEAQRAKRLKSSICQVLASESGRMVLAEIIGFCQVETINGLDDMAAARVEGGRSVGIQTIRMIRDADYSGFMKLYEELYHER
jgi:hypothetical protein